eukprot:scaffold184966_cov21-Tisochrysis_lutea.AAC.2
MHVHKTGFQGSRISKYRQEIRDACSQGTLAILQQTFGKKVVSGDKIVRVEAAVVLSYLQEGGCVPLYVLVIVVTCPRFIHKPA